MALLYSQFFLKDEILSKRREIFRYYQEELIKLLNQYHLQEDIVISSHKSSLVNGHLFFLVFKETERAIDFSHYLYDHGIETRSHFVPLHESIMGREFVRDNNDFSVEHNLGKRLIRLPIYPDLSREEQCRVIHTIRDYMKDWLGI
jgi:dTDP-4-amino-4,6-dideoxygalactose transaminase